MSEEKMTLPRRRSPNITLDHHATNSPIHNGRRLSQGRFFLPSEALPFRPSILRVTFHDKGKSGPGRCLNPMSLTDVKPWKLLPPVKQPFSVVES